MITEKEYSEACMIVKLYESQQSNIHQHNNMKISGDFRDDTNRESQSEYYGLRKQIKPKK